MTGEGQRHWLLDGRAGWRVGALERATLAGGGTLLQLQAVPGSGCPIVDAAGSFGGFALPTGLAVDADGRIYIVDNKASLIKRFDPCTETFEALPCVGGAGGEARRLLDPHGLAVSCTGDLYVADTGNRRVQVFALKGLPLRTTWGPLQVVRRDGAIQVRHVSPLPRVPGAGGVQASPEFPEGTWRPWDVLIAPDRWIYVTDHANGLIHAFDAEGCWRKAYSGEAPETAPLEKPTHVAIDQLGRFYVVQEGKSLVTVLDYDGEFLGRVEQPEEMEGPFEPVAVAVDGEGNLYLSEKYTHSLLCYCRAPGGVYAHVSPCREIEGEVAALAFDLDGNLLLANEGQRRVVCLKTQAAFETEGTYYSQALDSRIYRCQWHRLLAHAGIELGTRIQVDTFTSEAPKTTAEIRALPDTRWSTGQTIAHVAEQWWDCLVTSPPGRYLWLRLTLTGTGKSTPMVHEMRVFYPRNSSLRYLPAVYQEDPASKDFLDRFLSIYDTMREGVGDQIREIAALFDPSATPAESEPASSSSFLDWLASWVGLALDSNWPVEKRRRLLQQAHRLYALRGTPEGLRLHIRLYNDKEPHILEHFRLRRWLYLDHGRLGRASAAWGQAIVSRLQLDDYSEIGSFQLIDSGDPLRDPFHHFAHRFTVFVPYEENEKGEQLQAMNLIVQLAKPAHSLGCVQLVRPLFRVGVQSFVGIDTVIGRYPDGVITGEGQLGYDSLLGDPPGEGEPPSMRVGVHSRIGSSTLID
jgi:phage tail-like protein